MTMSVLLVQSGFTHSFEFSGFDQIALFVLLPNYFRTHFSPLVPCILLAI